jgi:hypothetical protein
MHKIHRWAPITVFVFFPRKPISARRQPAAVVNGVALNEILKWAAREEVLETREDVRIIKDSLPEFGP